MKKYVVCFLLVLAIRPVHAQLAVHAAYGHNMVLQRDQPISIQGRATPDTAITVDLNGLSSVAVAGADGIWNAVLDSLPAGGPYELNVAAEGQDSLTLTNVMLGDLWLASGQSNMEWTLYQTLNGIEEIASADFPQIRIFKAPKLMLPEAQWETTGEWAETSPETIGDFSAVAYFFGRHLWQELGVPIGLIDSSWPGTQVEHWLPADVIQRYVPSFIVNANYSQNYNAMIHPFIGMPIKGVIWYQGENNVYEPEGYRLLFPALIQNWRESWGQPELPVGFVQIAPYRYQDLTDGPSELRQAQFYAAETVPHTGMVVTMDIGNPSDIHPINKQEVGRRLGLWAVSQVYGGGGEFSGPVFDHETVEGAAIRIHFRHADGGLVTRDGGAPTYLEIAGADRIYYPAEGMIDGSTLVVSSAEVPMPVAVRFAWRMDAEPNLMNTAGLPAGPFQTMDWRDTDGDGLADRGEFAIGSDFEDPGSGFAVEDVRLVKGKRADSVVVGVSANPGSVVHVHWINDGGTQVTVPFMTEYYTGTEAGIFDVSVTINKNAGPSQLLIFSVR